MHGALRSAINQVDATTGEPDPTLLERTVEPHDRGAILVAAVFDAFLAIYKARVADLLRLVTGTGAAFPAGDLHPDLLNRMAGEANKAATHVLRMCIRALDYCPPVDITFGDYLRALVTADADLVEDDDLGYRVAVVEAFRRRGIYPTDCRSLSIDGLRWHTPKVPFPIKHIPRLNLDMTADRREIWRRINGNSEQPWVGNRKRRLVGNRELVWRWLKENGLSEEHEAAMGLALSANAPATIERSDVDGLPKVEVHSVRPARRVGPDGQQIAELVVEITQSRMGYHSPEEQQRADALPAGEQPEARFKFRGGCTLLIDLNTKQVRYAIRKAIRSEGRMERQRRFLFDRSSIGLKATYFARASSYGPKEPFALLHRAL